jgi:hypothetical protein
LRYLLGLGWEDGSQRRRRGATFQKNRRRKREKKEEGIREGRKKRE